MTGKHDAAYFRRRRAMLAKVGGKAKRGDYTQAPAALARGAELRRLELQPTLPWPPTLFGSKLKVPT